MVQGVIKAWVGLMCLPKMTLGRCVRATKGKVKGSLCCRADYSSLGHRRKPDPRAKLYYPCNPK